jgi:WD40 repeat protein
VQTGIVAWEIPSGHVAFEDLQYRDDFDGSAVGGMAFSPDGRWFNIVAREGIHVWDTKNNWKRVSTVTPPERSPSEPGRLLAFNFEGYSLDGKTLLTSTIIGIETQRGPNTRATVTLWETHTGAQGKDYQVPSAAYVCLTPDGSKLVTGGTEGGFNTPAPYQKGDTIDIWDVATGALVAKIETRNPQVFCLSLDGRLLASYGDDMLCVWDIGGLPDSK